MHLPNEFSVQKSRCHTNQYKNYPRCKSCIAKQGGPCYFIGFRCFKNGSEYGPYFTSLPDQEGELYIIQNQMKLKYGIYRRNRQPL